MPELLVFELEPPIFLLGLDLNDKKPYGAWKGRLVRGHCLGYCPDVYTSLPTLLAHVHRCDEAFLGALTLWAWQKLLAHLPFRQLS